MAKESMKMIRIMQGIFLGITALGVSMMAGDLLPKTEFPISPFSLTTTLFGIFGYIACEWIARKAEAW